VRVGAPVTDYRRAPQRNEDAEYIYSEMLGYDAERIERLTAGSKEEVASEGMSK
jgi:hypothetical protein